MGKVSPVELVQLLRQPVLRIRTGILLVPPEFVGSEKDRAARLDMDAVDLQAWKLQHIGASSRYLGLSWESLIRDLQAILSEPHRPGHCLLVYNLDLFLSAFDYTDRLCFWDFLRTTFKRGRGLLLCLPIQALHLLPQDQRALWEDGGRLAVWERVGQDDETAGG